MGYLLNIAYLLLVVLLSPLLAYRALRAGKYREGFAEKWLGLVPRREGNRPCAWLHAVSVGEVNLLATLLKELERRHPDWEFVVSTTSAAGHALAKKKYSPRTVFYCPLDFTWAVKNAFARIRPNVLLLAELEIWPNLIAEAHRQGTAVAIFNGRLSERSFRGYRWIAPIARRTLHKTTSVLAQNESYAQRFRALGAKNIHITGSLKFDGAETRRDNARTTALAQLAGIHPNDTVFLAGSTQAPEEQLALAAYQSLRQSHPRLRLILVPRHPERFDEVASLIDRAGEPYVRRSQLAAGDFPPVPSILLVDVIGELSAWWGMAHIGFVGGSLLNPRGGQNMIEPAAYGVATCFGPNTWNFRDIVQLFFQADAAAVIGSGDDLTAFVRRCLTDQASSHQLGNRARQLVLSQLGATARTADLLAPHFSLPEKRRAAA